MTTANPNVANINTMLMLGGFSNDDLNKISQTIAFVRSQIGKEQIQALRVGQRVSWTGKFGFQKGIVTKVARKYVSVRVDDGTGYRVPANMIQAN